MSVITSLLAMPSRMTIVWSYLLERGSEGVAAEELASFVRPVSLQKRQGNNTESGSPAMFNNVITEMQHLGIVTRSQDGVVTLTPESPKKDSHSLVEYLEQVLLNSESAAAHGQEEFPKAMAWLLTRDPYQPLAWKGGYRGQVSDDCGDVGAFDLTDEARSQQFIHWAVYLGYAWRLTLPNQDAVLPDPTVALNRNLPRVFPTRSQVPIADMMASLAERLTALEGGLAREEVESMISVGKRRHEQQLSRSTSLALERLEAMGKMKMERIADAPAINLDRGAGPRAVSHITWLGEN